MRRKFFVTVVLCLACLLSAKAQNDLRVSEAESQIILQTDGAEISLVVENPQADFDGTAEIELLDSDDKIRAAISRSLRIKNGKDIYKISLPLGDLIKTDEDEIVWYRLRYGIGAAQGIVSISELVENDFELRVAAGDYVFADSVYRVRIRAFAPCTNQPAQNISVEGTVTLNLEDDSKNNKLKIIANGATDAEGFAALDFKIPANAKFDDGKIEVTGRKNGIVREISEDLDAEANRGAVILSTDKPIYQPSQTFSVRALYLGANQKVVPDGELEFKIKDEDDTLLYRETVKTSAFGIASISWKIPDNAKLGDYHAEVEADQDLRENQINFKISRYDLPNFKVAAAPDKSFYLPDDKQAKITVGADYLFGKPVTKGTVRVVQESERHWNYKEQKYESIEEQKLEGATGADGKFTAQADLTKAFAELSGSDWERFKDLHFAAYFTDAATNKTEQKRFDVRLTKQPIHIYLTRRENLNGKLPMTAYVSTFYADGMPAACDVEVKGKREKSSQFESVAKLKTSRLGAGKFTFMVLPGGADEERFDLKINARDAEGQSGDFDEELYPDSGDALRIETEKTVFKPGEAVKINLVATKKDALIYVDVVRDWQVLSSYFVKIENGKGSLAIPYDRKFKGNLTVAAYTDDQDDDSYYRATGASRGIIFPERQNLKLNASFDHAVYKPDDEAKINFSVSDGAGQKAESALGVVIFDKAIEERARTDAEFGNYFSRFYGLLGYETSFGGITLKDLNELDSSKPISRDLQLAAEIMLAGSYYYPRIYRTSDSRKTAKTVYAEYFKRQFEPIETALKNQFGTTCEYPTDENSLREILRANQIDFDDLRDPWGEKYYAGFRTEKDRAILNFQTKGADKKQDAKDFSASSVSFNYFLPIGRKIDAAVKNFHEQTGGYVRDRETLRRELLKENFDLRGLRDRWNHEYLITFEISERSYLIRVRSSGADGIYQPENWSADDFDVWKSYTDYFAETEIKIDEILNRHVNLDKKPFPQSEEEFKNLLKTSGADIARIRDGYGNPVYLTFAKVVRYADKTVVENDHKTITPVTQETYRFRIRSTGKNVADAADDFTLAEFSSVITEQSKDTNFSKAEVQNVAVSAAKGAIRGIVFDANGAVIPSAKITAKNDTNDAEEFIAETNDEGKFLLANLPSGKYTIKISASNFKDLIYNDVEVRSQNLVEMNVTLEVGRVTETVTVTSDAATVNVSASQIAELPKSSGFTNLLGVKGKKNSVARVEENSTPRLRQYFPETLVWNPELLTDKNGRAQLKFKFADNITTWKLYTIASTKSGKIGVAEKEIRAFQPFFADLEPPKILTVGDEIYLPAQIRNYTEKSQKVKVTMADGNWFSFLSPAFQTISVEPGDSQNAVFGFRAETVVADGKQKVTAIAEKNSDAIEKSVAVHPNGQEIVETESTIFRAAATFDVNFPIETLPRTQRAELKIYPNLPSHVAESVTGLLKRPYGCGEQTISSTYPNLMILKFGKTAAIDENLKAQAQKFLQKGYERLLGFRQADGGFSVWTKDESDLALTAYAIRFLTDAKEFVAVDDDIIINARRWLLSQQKTDGSFNRKSNRERVEDQSRTKILTGYVARILAMTERGAAQKSKDTQNALERAFSYLENKNREIDEPFAIASLALALLDANEPERAAPLVEKLARMAKVEADGAYWNLETNTPFYGWGTAGRIETTALVVEALTEMNRRVSEAQRNTPSQDKQNKSDLKNSAFRRLDSEDLISQGVVFLLKNKDRYGVWYSTQATINVLDALLAQFAGDAQTRTNRVAEIFAGGKKIRDVRLPPSNVFANPLTIDLSDSLAPSANKIEVKIGGNDSTAMAQIVSNYYVGWRTTNADGENTSRSRQLRLGYKCDRTNAAVMQEINCAVEAERIGFQGYGMLLAEIGLPPGADVDRVSLEKARDENWNFSSYDVLPDKIIVYLWAQAGGTKFDFKFKPRYAINAQTAPSQVYDYYNPEARATVAPTHFIVR